MPFKAIFEIAKTHPKAYQVVVEYRNWLINEIYNLLLTTNANAAKQDAHMFLFVIDGAMVQLLDPNKQDERERLLEYFCWGLFKPNKKFKEIRIIYFYLSTTVS